MPRLTAPRRETKRAEIVSAARRCFSRDGFHRTSVPDIAAEAGASTGALYRYFTGKEEIILEIAGEAFRTILAPIERLVADGAAVTVADLVEAAVDSVAGASTVDAAGLPIGVDELLRCAVQSWSELLRHETFRIAALEGFERVRAQMAAALRRGQTAGVVPADFNPERGTRVVMALLHGFVLQRVAFGLDDSEGFVHDVRAALTSATSRVD